MTARPLLVSNDPDLVDDVVRLAAANAVEVHLATDVAGARSKWQLAPLVLVGGDAAMSLAGSGLGRRREIVLVCREPSPDDWKHAVVVGAEHVVSLPEGERWLIDRLADTGEGTPRNGTVMAVVGAGGGSGASTFAACLATVAARGRRVLLVDADPSGGGLDVLLGIEDVTGVRWPDLAQTRGRIGADSLVEALPRSGDLRVLAWGRERIVPTAPEVVAAVLDAASRGFDLVVVDIGRRLDAVAELVLARARRVELVAATRVRATAAAAVIAGDLVERCAQLDLVVRLTPRGVRPDAMADALGMPVAARLPFVRRLAVGGDEPRLPGTREAYGRACVRVVAGIAS